MLTAPFIVMLLAAVCMLFPLIKGAQSDTRNRTFPKKYWNTTRVILLPIIAIHYVLLLVNGMHVLAIALLMTAGISWLFFAFMGYRYGSGGDWRALMYIGIVTPLLILPTIIIALATGAIMVFVTYSRMPAGTNPLSVTIPFAVAILAGYIGSIVLFVWYIL